MDARASLWVSATSRLGPSGAPSQAARAASPPGWAGGQSWWAPEAQGRGGAGGSGPFIPCCHSTVFEFDLFLSDVKPKPPDADPGVGLRPLRARHGARCQLPPSPGAPGPA